MNVRRPIPLVAASIGLVGCNDDREGDSLVNGDGVAFQAEIDAVLAFACPVQVACKDEEDYDVAECLYRAHEDFDYMEEWAGDQDGFGACMEARLEYLHCLFENGECET